MENGKTLLILAADKHYYDIMYALIDAGADVNAKDSYGVTPLMVAIDWENDEIIKILKKAGAK